MAGGEVGVGPGTKGNKVDTTGTDYQELEWFQKGRSPRKRMTMKTGEREEKSGLNRDKKRQESLRKGLLCMFNPIGKKR